MRNVLSALSLLVVMAATGWSAEAPTAVALFDGKTLDGWKGNPASWSVRDGVIVGVANVDEPLPYNQFLVWQGGKPRNFELTLKLRMTGKNNSGIQYRSRENEGREWSVAGYQCDIHPNPPYCGMLYEEGGRGIVATRGKQMTLTADGAKKETGTLDPPLPVDLAEWTTFQIIARGTRLEHRVNGIPTVVVDDQQEGKRSDEGVIAFQLHRGGAMEVQIKDVMLKVLPDGP